MMCLTTLPLTLITASTNGSFFWRTWMRKLRRERHLCAEGSETACVNVGGACGGEICVSVLQSFGPRSTSTGVPVASKLGWLALAGSFEQKTSAGPPFCVVRCHADLPPGCSPHDGE